MSVFPGRDYRRCEHCGSRRSGCLQSHEASNGDGQTWTRLEVLRAVQSSSGMLQGPEADRRLGSRRRLWVTKAINVEDILLQRPSVDS
jgi:hypothetical protein